MNTSLWCCPLAALALGSCNAPSGPSGPGPTTDAVRVNDRRLIVQASDQASLPADMKAIGVRSLLRTGARMRYGEYLWDERGARAAGAMLVRIDLRRQLLSAFRGGDEIGTAVILYGADRRPTPRGRFPILAKLRDHRSSSYDAPMPYTLRLTGDGVSVHGSNVRYGAATHGCIGIPEDFARRLFSVVRRGDPVIIV